MSDDGFTPGFICGVVLMMFIFFMVTRGMDESWRHQIADHGCAEFYLDGNHDRQWRWTTNEKVH